MIKSKAIKILCYITMFFIAVLSIGIIAFGIWRLIENETAGFVFIFIGLVLPLLVSVSLYPIFALANIDENISKVNSKLDQISAKMNICQPREIPEEKENSQKVPTSDAPALKTAQKSTPKPHPLDQETVDYLFAKYKIRIEKNDTLATIKNKISSTEDKSSVLGILIKKISTINDYESLVTALNLHKAANPYTADR